MASLFVGALDPTVLICAAIGFAFFSGIPGLFLPLRGEWGQKVATTLTVAGSIFGTCGALTLLLSGRRPSLEMQWGLPFGPCEISFDPLSCFFLLPVFLISACSSLYARAYWRAKENSSTERRLTFFFGLLTGSLALVVTAANSVLFLASWEIMAVSAFFALTAMHDNFEVRKSGILYLITTHIGSLTLFAMFSLLKVTGNSYHFPSAGSVDGGTALAAAIFVSAIFGFGIKAGLMPLHVWLPSAHANAPTHVSALMSGVLIKTGIYGIVRVSSFFYNIPLWWGATIIAVGIVSGVLGVVFAIGQHDLKRLLAYHSIENIGIIAIGLGVALIGTSAGLPAITLLGITGALLHVLNHAIFKSLLFYSAGAIIHAIGTREIDLMGGVARRAPCVTAGFLVGAVAICGLPPLNGFVSEFLIYIGIFSGINAKAGSGVAFLAVAAPSLALIGGLAAACFIKVYGIAFLGLPRSQQAELAHDPPWPMRLPLFILAALCGIIGIFPLMLASPLNNAAATWQPNLASTAIQSMELAPFGWITVLNCLLLALVAIAAIIFRMRLAAARASQAVTWDCGYLKPAPRMQYTSSSFAEMLVNLFEGILRPHASRPSIKGSFPATTSFSSHVPEAVLDLVYLPFLKKSNERLATLRKLQHGQIHLYILYIFITLLALLVWTH